MINTKPDDVEWLISEVLADPHQVYILWIIDNKAINTLADLKTYIGKSRNMVVSFRALKKRGFLKVARPAINLQPIAEEVISLIRAKSPEAGSGIVLGNAIQATTDNRAASIVATDMDTEVVDSDDKSQWADDKLLLAASRGDEEAFVCLQTRIVFINQYLKGACIYHSVPEDVAYAIALQTLSRACEKLKRKPVPKRHREWLQRIARKEFRRWLLKNRTLFPSAPSLDITPYVPQSVTRLTQSDKDTSTLTLKARKSFDRLNFEDREILGLVMANGLTVADAGEQLGIDVEEAVQWFSRAIKRLDEFIESDEEIADLSYGNSLTWES